MHNVFAGRAFPNPCPYVQEPNAQTPEMPGMHVLVLDDNGDHLNNMSHVPAENLASNIICLLLVLTTRHDPIKRAHVYLCMHCL